MSNQKRVTYGFKLDFPAVFTLSELKRQKRNTVSYITLRKRVEKALKEGVIIPMGKQAPKVARKGRQELIYQRVNAQTPIVVVEAVPLLAPKVSVKNTA